jgi:hypothetical protein
MWHAISKFKSKIPHFIKQQVATLASKRWLWHFHYNIRNEPGDGHNTLALAKIRPVDSIDTIGLKKKNIVHCQASLENLDL